MKSFSVNLDVSINLWENLADNRSCTCAYDLIKADMKGTLTLARSSSIMAYEKTIKKNERMVLEKSVRKVIHFVSGVEDADSSTGGVNEERIGSLDIGYADIEDVDELKYTIKGLNVLRPKILLSDGVDIMVLLKRALEATPKAIAKLAQLCEKYLDLSEYVRSLFTIKNGASALGLV